MIIMKSYAVQDNVDLLLVGIVNLLVMNLLVRYVKRDSVLGVLKRLMNMTVNPYQVVLSAVKCAVI